MGVYWAQVCNLPVRGQNPVEVIGDDRKSILSYVVLLFRDTPLCAMRYQSPKTTTTSWFATRV